MSEPIGSSRESAAVPPSWDTSDPALATSIPFGATTGHSDEILDPHPSSPGIPTFAEESGDLAPPALTGFVQRSRAAQGVFPANPSEAVERVLAARQAYRDGVLQEEAERVGVCPNWMHEHNELPVRVAITEQLMPLTTLFAKLDRFGSPGTMVRALRTMQSMARQIEAGDTSLGKVEVGFVSSLDHGVVFKGITAGFFFVVPLHAPGANEERIQGRHFFSNKDEKRFKGAGYRDLTVSTAKLEEILGYFLQQGRFDRHEGTKHIDASSRQESFNERRRLASDPVTPEMQRRVAEGRFKGERMHGRADASDAFVADFRRAIAESETLGSGSSARVRYSDFISRYNEAFAARVLPGENFRVTYGEHLNTLPSFGIRDWHLFLSKFGEAGILQHGESVLRLRVEAPGTDPEYRTLTLGRMSRHEITLIERETHLEHRLEDLVERSRESLLGGGPPLLIPIAMMRYWGNYAMSSSLGLDDGMPYDKIKRVDRAMHDPEFAVMPRGLSIFPYTRLNSFVPADPEDPYDGFHPQYDALDYYQILGRV